MLKQFLENQVWPLTFFISAVANKTAEISKAIVEQLESGKGFVFFAFPASGRPSCTHCSVLTKMNRMLCADGLTSKSTQCFLHFQTMRHANAQTFSRSMTKTSEEQCTAVIARFWTISCCEYQLEAKVFCSVLPKL
jgi:hypothetical protein